MKMYQFPEIFITGKLPENWSKTSLIAYGISGWALCAMGANPPDKFGEGMALIATKVGTATPNGLSELADKLLANN